MFTGIVKTTGKVLRLSRIKNGCQLVIKVDQALGKSIPQGGSVSIDGVCLTRLNFSSKKLSGQARSTLVFELIDSTLKLTTLKNLKVGSRVNIEPAARLGDPLGGHFVSGHIDGIGVVHKIDNKANTRYLVIRIPRNLNYYLVPQGSVVVNGVSLTIVGVDNIGRPSLRRIGGSASRYRSWFSVALTSYTLKRTNLGDLEVGDTVNIEVDLLAKYISKFISYDLRNRRRAV